MGANARRSFKANAILSSGVVTGWLRFPLGTVTGLGYSSVPDILASPDNPAIQGTNGSRPSNSFSANGQPIADCDGTADYLSWTATTATNGTSVGGVAFWFRPDAVAAFRGIFTCTPGATNRFEITRNNTDLLVDVHHSQFVARRGTASGVFAAGTWYFLTFEFDGSQSTDATKCIITINGVVQSLTFSDGSGAPGAMPTALVAASGDYLIGARNSGGVTAFIDASYGPNLYYLGAKQVGATQGLCTSEFRNSLMTLEAVA